MALGIQSKHVAVMIFNYLFNVVLCTKSYVRKSSFIHSVSIDNTTVLPRLKNYLSGHTMI